MLELLCYRFYTLQSVQHGLDYFLTFKSLSARVAKQSRQNLRATPTPSLNPAMKLDPNTIPYNFIICHQNLQGNNE